MAWRFRAHLRFTPGSGMAAWGEAQLANRRAQAFHVRSGTPAEERSRLARDGDTLDVDLFFPGNRRQLARDTRDALSVGSVTAWLRPDTDEERSWMDYHFCRHDQDPPAPCDPPEWRWPS